MQRTGNPASDGIPPSQICRVGTLLSSCRPNGSGVVYPLPGLRPRQRTKGEAATDALIRFPEVVVYIYHIMLFYGRYNMLPLSLS
jgi:hypothetical protein